jgi:hypothetical protein
MKPESTMTKATMPIARALAVAGLATFIPVVLANAVFLSQASGFAYWRGPRTYFAFSNISATSPGFLLTCVAVGFVAVYTGKVLVPFFASLVLVTLYGPVFAWSGPGDLFNAISPLISLNVSLSGAAYIANVAILFLWISPWSGKSTKRRRSFEQAGTASLAPDSA